MTPIRYAPLLTALAVSLSGCATTEIAAQTGVGAATFVKTLFGGGPKKPSDEATATASKPDPMANIRGVWFNQTQDIKFVFSAGDDGHFCVGNVTCSKFTWLVTDNQITAAADNGTTFKFTLDRGKLHGIRDATALVLTKDS